MRPPLAAARRPQAASGAPAGPFNPGAPGPTPGPAPGPGSEPPPPVRVPHAPWPGREHAAAAAATERAFWGQVAVRPSYRTQKGQPMVQVRPDADAT